MLLNDALKGWGSTRAVPHAVGIDHSYWAFLAYAEAVRLGTVDLAVLRQVEFDEPLLQVFP